MTRSFAADPTNGKACKLVEVMTYGYWILVLISYAAAVNASLAMLRNVTTVRRLIEYSDPTYLDIVRVILVGVGTFLFCRVAFNTLLPEVLFRKHLQKGTILRIDESIVSLDLSKCEDPAAVRFRLQQDRNAYLERYVKKPCHQQ